MLIASLLSAVAAILLPRIWRAFDSLFASRDPLEFYTRSARRLFLVLLWTMAAVLFVAGVVSITT
jgi:hypothetical protein